MGAQPIGSPAGTLPMVSNALRLGDHSGQLHTLTDPPTYTILLFRVIGSDAKKPRFVTKLSRAFQRNYVEGFHDSDTLWFWSTFIIPGKRTFNFIMELSHSKQWKLKPRIALVQGESFRCVAIESKPGRWKKVQDGSELPQVLEILLVLENDNPVPDEKLKP
jgi:hypothetical protein